jgi:choline dehydrogenase-like flavoprotein
VTDSAATCDVIVVGSGPSAVNAAYPLVEAGLRVTMLDVGNRDTTYDVPEGAFTELRRTDVQQHRYLLGESFEGIALGHANAGAQLTPPRQYIQRDVDRLLPVVSGSFFPLQSLAEGGLGAGWGAGSPQFCDADLDGFPIRLADLRPHYEAVAARIGISGAHDDLEPFLGELDAMQPAVAIDSNGESILRRYEKKRAAANRAGLYIGHPRLAMLSRPLRGRSPTRYWDMDFWSDAGKSIYRPRWTVDELRGFANFTFVGRRLVQSFEERPDGDVIVRARVLDTEQLVETRGRAVILAAGTLGTARIVLRSYALYGRRIPLVCNPHTYVAMLNANSLGKDARDARHSMAQLCVVHAPDGPTRPFTVGHVYSYRSLLLFRLMKYSPLPFREGLDILRLLSPSFTVLILQHEDRPSPEKYCSLARATDGGEDRLEVEYALSAADRARHDAVESTVLRNLLRLRCITLRTMHEGNAASTHFAGTFPMTAIGGDRDDLTTDRNGRLRRARNVYIGDGSVFPSLPSKGLTFTMMANADRIGCHLRAVLGR